MLQNPLAWLLFPFFLLSSCQLIDDSIQVQSDPNGSIDPEESPPTLPGWFFLDPLKYVFNPDHIEIGNGKASLKLAEQTYAGTDFNKGTHVGTYVNSNGNLSMGGKTSDLLKVTNLLKSRNVNLLGYWRLDGNYLDESGNAFHGTPVGDSVSFVTESQLGSGSVQLGGSADYVESLDDPLDVVGDMTISLWIRTTDVTTSVPVSKYIAGADRGWMIVLTGAGKAEYDGRTGNATYYSSGSSVQSVNDGSWHHLVGQREGATFKIFIDGTLANSSIRSSDSFENPEKFRIGVGTTGGFGFTGEIDEVAYWNMALSNDDILNLYQNQALAFSELSPSWTPKWNNIVGYWKMDGNWQDSSGNGNDITPVGSAGFSNIQKIGSNSGGFDGSGAHLSLNLSLGDYDTGSLSFCFWVRPNNALDDNAPFGTLGNRIYINQFSGTWRIGVNVQINALTGKNISELLWQHLCVTLDGNNAILYKDGRPGNLIPYASYTLISLPTIGKINGTPAFFDGSIDDFAIWDTPLSSESVVEIYNRQKQKYAGHYDSPVIDLGISGKWDNLKAKTTLPFYKELPSTGESSSDYSDLSSDFGDSLVALWHFDEFLYDGTAGEVKDESIDENHLTAFGGSTTRAEGQFSNAVYFDGVNDYLEVSTGTNIPAQTTSNITISAWVYPEILQNGTIIINLGNTTSSPTIGSKRGIYRDAGKIYFYSHASANNVDPDFSASSDLDLSKWNHLAITLTDLGALNIYKNGQNIGTTTLTLLTDGGNSIQIGGPASFGWQKYFKGFIDEVAIWSRTLSASEITQLYRRGANRIKYQVKSCADSACKCSVFSGTSPTSNDCNGDGIDNAIDSDPTGKAQWLGKNGVTDAYFSELQNCDLLDINGDCSGDVNTITPNFTFIDFPLAAQPINNRYFQYRILMEAENNAACNGGTEPCTPELTSIEVGPTDRFYGGTPTIRPITPVSYSTIKSLSISEAGSCSLTYQLSSNGTNYNYWNGSQWVPANGVAQSSPSADLVSNISTFTSQSGPGSLYWIAFMASDTTQSCELDRLSVTVDE